MSFSWPCDRRIQGRYEGKEEVITQILVMPHRDNATDGTAAAGA
jgi:hypothetical protein